jgi:hypothetical protein
MAEQHSEPRLIKAAQQRLGQQFGELTLALIFELVDEAATTAAGAVTGDRKIVVRRLTQAFSASRRALGQKQLPTTWAALRPDLLQIVETVDTKPVTQALPGFQQKG